MIYIVLDNQKALENTFKATTLKVEEHSRTFQVKMEIIQVLFKDFSYNSRLCETLLQSQVAS